jgi:hypothetical protein
MNVSGAAIKFAEKNGISIPEFVKFLASPAGYALSKVFDAVETQANLPQGILGLAQNPVSGATDYLKTQASNAIYNQNEPSKIESIISELQGANPDRPNYVGPQEVDSPLSQLNTSNLSRDLGVTPSDEFAGASSNNTNMNDDLRSGLYGNQSENFYNFVGPVSEDSPAFQSDLKFLPEALGVQPTTATTSNTGSSTNNSSIPPEVLQTIGGNVEGKSLQEDMNNISNAFGNTSPASLGLAETQSMPDYSRAYSALGGAEVVNNLRDQFLNMGLDENTIGSVFSNYYAPETGGGKLEDFSYSQYRQGGQIYRGVR